MLKKNIIYTYPTYSSFVAKDYEVFKKRFDVKSFPFRAYPKWRVPFVFLRQFFFLLFNLHRTDYYVTQFGGYLSFLPSFFGKVCKKKNFIILCGTDCVSFPSIGYGNFSKKILGLFTKWSYQLASYLVPIHENLILHDYTYQSNDFPKQGYLYFCPRVKTPAKVIHNGYDSTLFYLREGVRKNKMQFITVAGGLEDRRRQLIKGIDLILEAAPFFPDALFTIIGWDSTDHEVILPSNVKIFPSVDYTKVVNLYQEPAFYLQLSMSESFGNALCEAMLCECIPVGTAVGAMPFIIGDTGFILPYKDVELLKPIINQCLSLTDAAIIQLGQKARRRISDYLSMEKRELALLQLVD